MAKPGAKHDSLERFCGSWVGKVVVPPSPQLPDGLTAESRVETTRELGGWFGVMNYEQKQPGDVVYTAHGVIGYDEEKSQYTFHWFDSEGWDTGSPGVGQWEGDSIVFSHVSSVGQTRMTFDFTGSEGYEFSMDTSQDGLRWSRLMNESFKPSK